MQGTQSQLGKADLATALSDILKVVVQYRQKHSVPGPQLNSISAVDGERETRWLMLFTLRQYSRLYMAQFGV